MNILGCSKYFVLLFFPPTLRTCYLFSVFSLSPKTLGLTVKVTYFMAFSVGDSHKMTVCQELLFLRETFTALEIIIQDRYNCCCYITSAGHIVMKVGNPILFFNADFAYLFGAGKL